MNDADRERIDRVRHNLPDGAPHLTDEQALDLHSRLTILAEICIRHVQAGLRKGFTSDGDMKAYLDGRLNVDADGRQIRKYLPDLECPECKMPIRAPLTAEPPKAATSYEDCLRKCSSCHTAWSNARSDPVRCVDRPTRNVPKCLRAHLNNVLDSALNERNRENKKAKFCFESSEDAATWTLFRGLQPGFGLPSLLKALLPSLDIRDAARCTLLLWGCPIPPTTRAIQSLRAELIAVSKTMGENPQARTEPDVLIDAGDAGMIIVEVKLHSGNEVRDDKTRFTRYLTSDAFVDPAAAVSSGYYELVRNWSIGVAMARNRPFHMINLGPDRIFDDKTLADRWASFCTGIGTQSRRHFHRVRWSQVLEVLSAGGRTWIAEFVRERLNRRSTSV